MHGFLILGVFKEISSPSCFRFFITGISDTANKFIAGNNNGGRISVYDLSSVSTLQAIKFMTGVKDTGLNL